MKVKYIGGRSRFEVSLNRKPYYFTPENKKILDIQDKNVINYIFSLPNRQEFEVVVEPQEIVFNAQNNTVSSTVQEDINIEPEKTIKTKKLKRGK